MKDSSSFVDLLKYPYQAKFEEASAGT